MAERAAYAGAVPFRHSGDQDEAVVFRRRSGADVGGVRLLEQPIRRQYTIAHPTGIVSTASNPTPAATPSSATPDANCLNGRYDLVRFVGVGAGDFGTGEGGDVTITFDNGSYLLRGAGKDPIKLTVAGQTADLLVDGTISGDYRVAGNQATFTVGREHRLGDAQHGTVEGVGADGRGRQRARSEWRGRISVRE